MARISTVNNEVYYQMKKFLGLNELEDGTTRLKFGEAAESYNWRITSSQALQVRQGTETICSFSGNANGLWNGNVNGVEYLVCCVGTKIYALNFSTTPYSVYDLGNTEDAQTHFFAYSNKLYAMNGTTYKVWDGSTESGHIFTSVTGYVPIILTEARPSGGGTELQGINLLSTHRKVLFSPTNSATEYNLPESLDSTEDKMTCVQIKFLGKEIWPDNEDTSYTYTITNSDGSTLTTETNINDGKINITRDSATTPTGTPSPLPTGTSTLMIEYIYPEDVSSQIKNMKFSESYNGNNGNRVFVYGDGTHKCFYSGLDYYGNATAEYFPAVNEIAIGEANTPITAMIRHYGRLIVYKSNSTYSINYTTITLESGSVTAGFVVQNVNKMIGNIPYGQAALIANNPISIHIGSVYQWKSNSSYNGNLTYDERQAHRISDRIETTLRSFNLNNVICFDNNYDQEYFIFHPSTEEALIYNYEKDLWFKYTDFPVKYMAQRENEIYCLCTDGTLRHFSREHRNDDDGTGYHDTVKATTEIDDAVVTIEDETFYTKFGSTTGKVTLTYNATTVKWSAQKYGEQTTTDVTLTEIGVTLKDSEGEVITPENGDVIVLTGNVEVNPKPIKAFWRSGSLAFDKDWMRKYSSTIWISALPEYDSDVIVTARSDVRSDYAKKKIGYSLISFIRMNFAHFSFGTHNQPKMTKVKLKVKKFTYYQLCFEFNMNDDIQEARTDNTATILGVDFQIRYAGNVK